MFWNLKILLTVMVLYIIIDGQHRVYGYANSAYKTGNNTIFQL